MIERLLCWLGVHRWLQVPSAWQPYPSHLCMVRRVKVCVRCGDEADAP